MGSGHRRGPGHRAGAGAAARPHRPARTGGPGRAGRPQGPAAAAVEPLLALRATLRDAGNFAAADAIREALAAAGLDISDTPEGTRWQPAETTLTRERLTWASHLVHVHPGLGPGRPGRNTLLAWRTRQARREEPDPVPGMNSGLSPGDPTLVAAFRSALLHQGVIALIMIVFLGLVWATARTWRSAGPPGRRQPGRRPARTPRPGRRRPGAVAAPDRVRDAVDLRRSPAGAAEDGGRPGHAGHRADRGRSPAWVQHLVNWGGTVWSYHPVQAGAASVWIQIGIGAWLIAAARGAWSRLAGRPAWPGA